MPAAPYQLSSEGLSLCRHNLVLRNRFERALHNPYVRLGGRRLRYLGRELRQRRLGCKVVNSAGITLWIDPADLRAQRLYAGEGVLDINAVEIWHRLLDDFRPNVVLDVGANYGEVALSHRYGSNVTVHLVEANPRLVKILAKTIRPLIGVTLHKGAATDKSGTVRLYRSRVRSGVSSIKPRPNRESIRVDAFRLDQRIGVASSDRLLFKIDVEGAETDVLRGMASLLDHCTWIGMVEIAHLDLAQLDFLQSMFRVRLVVIDPWELVPLSQGKVMDLHTLKRLGFAKDAIITALST